MPVAANSKTDRRSYIGGSDARIIMSADAAAVVRLWREKRGEVEPEDLSGNLLVQFGQVTEELNRRWFEQETGRRLDQVQRFLCATRPSPGWAPPSTGWSQRKRRSSKPSSCCRGRSPRTRAADKHMAQLQHNMLVSGARRAYLSILTGGAKWVLIEVEADPLYQTVLLQVERIFWRCVKTGEVPSPFDVEPPKAKRPVVRIVDMAASNAWAEQAAVFLRTREAHFGARDRDAPN